MQCASTDSRVNCPRRPRQKVRPAAPSLERLAPATPMPRNYIDEGGGRDEKIIAAPRHGFAQEEAARRVYPRKAYWLKDGPRASRWTCDDPMQCLICESFDPGKVCTGGTGSRAMSTFEDTRVQIRDSQAAQLVCICDPASQRHEIVQISHKKTSQCCRCHIHGLNHESLIFWGLHLLRVVMQNDMPKRREMLTERDAKRVALAFTSHLPVLCHPISTPKQGQQHTDR